MRGIVPFLCLSAALVAGGPLRIVAVERPGPPPYEEPDRRYRLEGQDVAKLHIGQRLRLHRPGDPRAVDALEVLSKGDGFAMAMLHIRHEAFPLKGDLVVAQELKPLPAVPRATWSMLDVSLVQPSTPNPTLAKAPTGNPIYFLKGSAALSPGAVKKLRAWIQERGGAGSWRLGVPVENGSLSALNALRVEALRLEFRIGGVEQVDLDMLPPEKPGRFDPVYVDMRP